MTNKSLIAVRTIAVYEAAKAALVLLAGIGCLSLIHHDVQAAAERLIRLMQVNPAHHYPRIFIEAASKVTDARLWFMAWFALLYTVFRGAEAWGLWWERTWAEWLALVSSGIYLPVEIYELFHHATWIKAGVLITNIFIVVYMAWRLRVARKGKPH
jgi:uncharacterized membrane protein (DUF2068 family)